MAESATVIGISSPSLNDSCPLSFEGIQLEENPPFNVAEKFSQVAQVSQKNYTIETPHGTLQVSTQGDPTKPAILTYHDVGTNSSTCFNCFLSDVTMQELVPHFYWIHINAPGQEEDATDFLSRYMFPSVTELAQQIGMVLEYFELSCVIGFGVGAGANVLARYAILSPDQVRGLVLVNFSPDSVSWDNLAYYSDKLVSYLLRNNKLQNTVQKYLMTHSLMSHTSDADLTAMYNTNFEQLNPHNLALFLEAYSKRSPLTNELKGINCQCLFVFNKGFEGADQLNELNSISSNLKSTILEIADSGHLVLDEQPQRVAAGLRLFLQGLGHAVTLGVRSPGHSYHQLYLKGVAIQ